MSQWKNGLLITAMLAGGCTGNIVGASGSSGSGATTGSGTGGGTSSSGTGGTKGSSSGGNTGSGNTPGGSGNSTGAGGDSTPAACAPGIPPTSQLRRLTNAQYEGAIKDLVGVTTLKAAGNVAPSILLATDQDGSLTDLAWSTYQSVADMIATQVFADATLKKMFMACTPTGDGKACLHDTILKFGRKAFRRPLTTDEVAAFDKIVTDGAKITATGTTDEVAQTVLYMFLISPSFLQRGEIGQTADSSGSGRYQLTPYEVATRLSFMLWGTTPDDALNQAADAGQLSTPAQVLTQAQRMLKDNRARDKVAAFHRYYVLMTANSRWDNANHDPKLFSKFSPSMVPTLEGEMERFFDDTVFKKSGTFQDLLLSPTAFVTSATAPIYGLDASKYGTDYMEAKLDASQRPGFLTRAGFLGAYSSYSRTSPILRGAFVTKQIIGTVIPSPPAGVEATPLPMSTDLDTNRKQVTEQTKGDDCIGCHHGFINPPGFVLEAFNSIGESQTKEASTGTAIDTSVDMMIDGKSVHLTTPLEMMKAIAASPGAQQRYANRLVSYAFEREDALDCGTINDLATRISAGGYTITNLITDLTQAQSFRIRATDGVTQ
jgi:hypothetical protein